MTWRGDPEAARDRGEEAEMGRGRPVGGRDARTARSPAFSPGIHRSRGSSASRDASEGLTFSSESACRAGSWRAGNRPGSDVRDDPGFARSEAAFSSGIRAAAAFPITGTRGVRGVIELFSRRTRRPDQPLMDAMAGGPLPRAAHRAPPRGGGGAARRSGARSGARVRHRLGDHDEPPRPGGRVQRPPSARSGTGARRRWASSCAS